MPKKITAHSIIFRSHDWIEQISEIKYNLLLHHFISADSKIVHGLSYPWRLEVEIDSSKLANGSNFPDVVTFFGLFLDINRAAFFKAFSDCCLVSCLVSLSFHFILSNN